MPASAPASAPARSVRRSAGSRLERRRLQVIAQQRRQLVRIAGGQRGQQRFGVGQPRRDVPAGFVA